MPSKANELTGKVFTKLTVVAREGSNKFKKALWRCQCECGKQSVVVGQALLKGTTKSCGCWKEGGQYNVIHGAKRASGATKAYSSWSNMKNRCDNPINGHWHNYGGRGISYTPEWVKFSSFIEDMGEPEPGMTLDRIDNDLGYNKENCRWTDRVTQRRNSRSHVVYATINEERLIATDAVRKYQIVSLSTVYSRINRGWSPEAAVTTPYTRADNKGYIHK